MEELILIDEFDAFGSGFNPFRGVMKILVSEECVKAVAVYADIIITHIS